MQAPRTSLLVVVAVWLGACGLEQPASVETGFETDGPAFTISGAGLVVGGLSNNRSLGPGRQNWGFTEGPSYTTARSLLSAVFPGIQFVTGIDAITPDVLNAVDMFVIAYPGVGGRAAEVSTPTLIGPYRVVRLLGRGGMGYVHFAQQQAEDFQRAVAVKVIRRGRTTGARVFPAQHACALVPSHRLRRRWSLSEPYCQ